MEKEVAKIFKKYGNEKVEILKKYRAKSFLDSEQRTTAITCSRLELNETLANILDKGSDKEHKQVAKALRATFREDWKEGKVIKY